MGSYTADTGRTIHELTNDVWFAVVGPDWTEKIHKSLDFSSEVFALETLGGSSGGLWNPLLNLRRLEELNLRGNRLTDVDRIFIPEAPFAGSLRVLNLSKNLLTAPIIDLSQLTILDLSNNSLDAFPCLDYLPHLEVLRLANNRITSIWEDIGKCPKLIELDVTNNAISLYPSQLEWGLYYLRGCPKLRTFSCKGNPFSNWFPEHVYFLALGLPNLSYLDDWELSESARHSAAKFQLKSLGDYDTVYEERRAYQETLDPYERPDPSDLISVLEDIPPIQYFATQVQRALQTPEQAIHWCSLIVHGADLVYNSPPSDYWKLFREKTSAEEGPSAPPSKEASLAIHTTIASFLQNITFLTERHETIRNMALRALAKFGPVPNYEFGPMSLGTLSELMLSNEEVQGIVVAAVAESLVPCIQGQSYSDIRCRTVLEGLSRMKASVVLAEALAPCATDLANFLEDEPTDPVLITVVSMLVDSPPNAVECSGQGVPQVVGETLREFATDGAREKDFIKLLHIAGCCAAAVKKSTKYFVTEGIHTNLIFQSLKEHFRTADTYRWPLQKASLVAGMIDFLTGIIKMDEQGMVDCVDSFHLTDLLLVPIKEYVADPVVLGAACRGILAIISDPTRQSSLLQYITEQVNRLEPLLQYFGGRIYKDVCSRAEQHVVQKDTLPFRPSVPEMQVNANPYIHDCFQAIGRLLHFYLAHTEIPYCVVVNTHLGTKRREKALFKVLLVPNNAVKFAAISCLALVPIENFDADDVVTLLALLKTFRAFASGDAAGIVVALLNVLQRFVDDVTGEAGQLVRRVHPQETFDSVYELLLRAAKLWPKSVDGADMKNRICVACVGFLRGASRYVDLRPFMRTKSIAQQFRSILKAEEDTCKPDSQDVAVERCWTGRQVNLLLRCFSGLERLNPYKRVAFRTMTQLADVLEGRSAMIDLGTDITLQALCSREEQHFDDAAVRKQLAILDESEWDDRIEQQCEFVQGRGPERILGCLSRLASQDFGVRLAVERKEKKDSEYWAGRLKAVKEEMEQCLDNGEDIDEEYGLPAPMEFYPKPDSYEDETRWIMLQALHRTDHSLDPQISSLYLRCETGFYGSQSLWENIVLGEMRTALIIAAALRCLYACLVVPVSDMVSGEVKRHCRRPATIRKLISLLEAAQLFDCHIGSKFLALSRLAITLEPHQAAESMDVIITYDILTQVIQRLVRPFQAILKQSTTKPLGPVEQTFATEVCSLMAVIIRQTSWIKFSAHYPVQRWAVTFSLVRFTGEIPLQSTLTAIVQMVMYDLQVAAGSARGTFIEHLLEVTASGREAMREACLVILAEIIQRCDPLKYEALELFSRSEVFQKAALRRTFLFELLEAANSGHYRQAVQLHLSVKHKRAERVLQLPIVHRWVLSFGQAEAVETVLGITNYCLYRIKKPVGIRNFKAGASHTSMLNASTPVIQSTSEYYRMTRLVRGFPAHQVLLIGWMPEGVQAKRSGKDPVETYEVIICNTLASMTPLLQCLYALSGPDAGSRVNVYRDIVFRMCIKDYVPLESIKTASHVIRLEPDQKPRLVVHVLTEERFFEFRVDWRYWFAPSSQLMTPTVWQSLGEQSSDDEEIDDRRKQRQGLDNFLGYLQDGNESMWDAEAISAARDVVTTGMDSILTALPDFTGSRHHESSEMERDAALTMYKSKLDIAKKHLLKLTMKHKVHRIHAVTFGSGEEPSTVYRFALKNPKAPAEEEESSEGENEEAQTPVPSRVINYQDVSVVYLDDSTRERWRRHLAYALNKLEVSGHWRRTWRTK